MANFSTICVHPPSMARHRAFTGEALVRKDQLAFLTPVKKFERQ